MVQYFPEPFMIRLRRLLMREVEALPFVVIMLMMQL
jgi:hypothetical protein